MSLSSRLNCRVDLYGKTPSTNELEETTFVYSKVKTIWAEILQENGSTQKGEGNTMYSEVSHKFTIRTGTTISNDMYFMFKGQRYDIKYFNPNYKFRDRIEVFCSLVVE